MVEAESSGERKGDCDATPLSGWRLAVGANLTHVATQAGAQCERRPVSFLLMHHENVRKFAWKAINKLGGKSRL